MNLKYICGLVSLSILPLSVPCTIFAQDSQQQAGQHDINNDGFKPRVEPDNQCNMFLRFPIGGTPEQLISLFGQPTDKIDISILTYTWKVDDNFLTLQYDRGTLTSVEIDKFCDGVTDHDACDLFRDYKTNWPARDIVEAKLGQPIEKGTISREEWLYKSATEKAYIELQNGSVEDIECIPVKYIYVPAEESKNRQKSR